MVFLVRAKLMPKIGFRAGSLDQKGIELFGIRHSCFTRWHSWSFGDGTIRKKSPFIPEKEQSRSMVGYRWDFRDQEMFGAGHLRRRRENQDRGPDVRWARVST
jgi:hypothetical protein